VKEKRFREVLALAVLLSLWVFVAAFQTSPPPAPLPAPAGQPAGAPRTTSVVLDGRELPVAVLINPSGPSFALEPLVQALGGRLALDETGESYTLTIAGSDIVIGPGSSVVTVGENIVSLSQPVVRGEGKLQVPLDFLRKTWGDLQGFNFDWHPESSRLTIGRRGARELTVLTDVVHQQGITTVVLQFNDVPRYRISKQPGQVQVLMAGDRLTPPPVKEKITDPLVQDLTVAPEQIDVQLVPGVEVESYILESPFRLVLDVHPPSVSVTTEPAPVPRERAPGIHTIVIDPGHGGTETGAIGPSGVQEKELTLLLARDLEARLESRLPVRVVLTRNEDAQLPLDTRSAIANQNKADLFVSIHLNSSLGTGASGTETYFLSNRATDPRAASSAAAENVASPEGTTGLDDASAEDLQLILWDLAQSQHLAESQRFANLIQAELNQALGLKDRGVKQAPFRVLMGAAMPAVLVELGFISNPDEEAKLQNAEYRGKLIDALATAIVRYKALVENTAAPAAATPAAPGAPAAAGTPSAPPPASPTPKPPGTREP
jgi:N-acetylmuramoyl-L-alanine amidase